MKMDKEYSKEVSNFYNDSYESLGFKAQRLYPNEELCRFMGRNFFSIPKAKRHNIKILETGCGSGANLWMIAKEGFSAYGADISQQAISLCKSMLESHHVSAELTVQDMAEISFPENYFDAVVDVFSSYCLTKKQGAEYLQGIKKILKPGGLFFSYFPSKKSDCFQFPEKANFIDSDTLNSVLRQDAPFYGQLYPFRFIHPREYENALLELGFEIPYSETVNRTYKKRTEIVEFVVIEAKNPDI